MNIDRRLRMSYTLGARPCRSFAIATVAASASAAT